MPMPLRTTGPGGTSDCVARWQPDALPSGSTGDPITSWTDSGPSALVASQGTAAARPSLVVNALAGFRGALFDGTDDWLTVAGAGNIARNVGGVTVIAVYRATAMEAGGSAPRRIFAASDGDSSAQNRTAMEWLDTRLAVSGRRLDADSLAGLASTGAADASTSFIVQTGVINYTAATAQVYKNGTQIASGAFHTAGSTSDTASAGVGLGAQGNGGFPMRGTLVEVAIFDRALTTAERAAEHTAMQDRYGITVADYTGGTDPDPDPDPTDPGSGVILAVGDQLVTAMAIGDQLVTAMHLTGTAPAPTLVSVLGDSYASGYDGAGIGDAGWPAIIAAQLGGSLQNWAIGGTGYVNDAGGHPFPVRADLVSPGTATAIVFGSLNDQTLPPADVGTAATATYQRIAQLAPGARLIVVGPAWPNATHPTDLLAVRDAVRTAALAAGATWIDPLAEGWFDNRPDLIGPDGWHPTDAGHQHIADKISPHLADSPTEPTAPTSTGGTGGSLTDQTNLSFTDNAGVTSTYHCYAAGLDWSKRVGILIYTDGSGEFGLKNPTSTYLLAGTNGMIAVAKRNNMVLLTPLAPGDDCTDGGGSCWYIPSYDGTGEFVKNDWSRKLVDHIYTRYDIDLHRVAFGGYSSGAQWTTEFFGTKHAPAIMNDGVGVAISYGGIPQTADNTTTTHKANVVHVWDTGADDPSYTNSTSNFGVVKGEEWYRNNGFTTQLHVVPGVGHGRSGQFGAIMDREIIEHVISADAP